MVDVSKTVVTVLKTILPTYYENFLDSKAKIPCISYFVYSNVDGKTCDVYGWSDVTMCIKVWDKKVESMMTNSKLVDSAMRTLGFVRSSATEMKQDNLICNVMNYRAKADEKY